MEHVASYPTIQIIWMRRVWFGIELLVLQATWTLATGLEIDRLPFVDFDSDGQYKNF